MYVLYTDESGKAHNPRDDVIVVAGIGVHEDAVRPLAGEINGILKRHVGNSEASRLEIHSRDIRSGRHGWRRVSRPKRMALADALLGLIGRWEHEGSGSAIRPFAVVIDRGRTETPVQMGYAELLYAFDKELRAKRRDGDGHNCVLIADEGQYEAAITSWVEVARGRPRNTRSDKRRLHALVETPFFVDSRSTRLMQLADLVCYALYRAYNADDWAWADHLIPSIRAKQGILLHVAENTGCVCVACEANSRRGRRRASRQLGQVRV